MSEINEIKKQYMADQWKQFLKSVKLTNLRGWTGQKIEFHFPVCAIVGVNGIGKSSFLKAAACAYTNNAGKTYYPSSFFLKTQWDDSAINGACIEYELNHGELPLHNFKWKKTSDWGFSPKGKRCRRDIFFLDVSRTLPLDAMAGYAKIAKLSSEEKSHTDLDVNSVQSLSEVLGKAYSAGRFSQTEASLSREVGILTTSNRDISQFHQGAGEDATLDLFKMLQKIPDNALLIIDEIEASLHPQAQRRLVRHLLKLARIKKLQIIVSTHSPFILEEIPPEGRVLLLENSDTKEILYNVSPRFALSTTDEMDHPDLYVFVEDEEAVCMINQFINESKDAENLRRRVAVRYIGDYNVVITMGRLAKNNKLPYKSLAIVDGDKQMDAGDNCKCLQGNLPPEKLVFSELQSQEWCELDARFGIGAGDLYKFLNDAMLIEDHHEWTRYVGDKIHKSKDTIWEMLVDEWSKKCCPQKIKDDLLQAIIDKIEE